jgi:hypothetical protein
LSSARSDISPGRPLGRARWLLKLALVNVGVFLLLFAVVEGLLSTFLFAWDVARERVISERHHTAYDPELGWVNLPNVHIPDLYGPGIFLRTNEQGFRGSRTFPRAVPNGKRRVICTGDSVTFGFGVDDLHTWCSMLESLDSRLETVNMGQGGYGVDQAYLWYKRAAGELTHQVQLFAPITEDFRRAEAETFFGYGKPRLEVENGSLKVTNVPVPMRSYYAPWVTESIQHLGSLRAAAAVRRVHQRITRTWSGSSGSTETERNTATAQLVYKILEDLQRLNSERSSQLVLIYLPTLYDHPDRLEFWSSVLEEHTRALDIPFINLVEEFKKLSDEDAALLYLPDRGHFNVRGNTYVADLIYQQLHRMPTLSRVLFSDDRP